MTKNEELVLREQIGERICGMEIDGLVLEGRTTEGFAFSFDDRVVVVKVIVKKEDFDLADALEEYEEKEKARVERESKKAAKLEKVKSKKS